LQRLHKCDHDGGLAGTAHIDVAHDHDRNVRVVGKMRLLPIAQTLARNGGAYDPGQRPEQCAGQSLALPGGMDAGHQGGERVHGGLCVAKLTRSMPAMRAASMARTTASWVALASALMTRTASSLPAAATAVRRAVARSSAAVTD